MAAASIQLTLVAERETTDYVRYDEPRQEGVTPVLRSQRVDKPALVAAFGAVPKYLRVEVKPAMAPGAALEV